MDQGIGNDALDTTHPQKPIMDPRRSNVTHDSAKCHLDLASTPIALTYLAEGNANVIYTINTPSQPSSEHNGCSVLRLRKDLPFTRPCIEVVSAFRERVAPLFSPDFEDVLLPQTLLSLTPGMVEEANAVLVQKEREGARGPKRAGTVLPKYEVEGYGVVMPNLQHKGRRLVEFKAKWLWQSPSASKGAVRCRTCALNAVRRLQGKGGGRGDSGFCPLDLLSSEDGVLRSVLSHVDAELPSISGMVADFKTQVQPALRHLKRLQQEHGQVGLEDFQNPVGKDFSLAMALRDCSCFLVIDGCNDNQPILDVKFADLDLKTVEGGKLQKWTQTEEQLLSSGAYTDPELEQRCALRPEPQQK